jgi:hypothetical protein
LFFTRTSQAQKGKPAAELIALMGNAEIKSQDETQFRPAKLKDALYAQDQIRTLEGSRAKLWFQDESILVLSEKTTIDIAKFQTDNEGRRQSALMKILEGSMRFIVHKFYSGTGPNFEIQGATAVVGIRGTDGVIETHSPDNIFLLSGQHALDVFNKTTGQRIILGAGNFVLAGVGKTMSIKPITPEMRHRLMGNFRLAQTPTTPTALLQPPTPEQGSQQLVTLGNPLVPQSSSFLNTLNPSANSSGDLLTPLPAVHPPLNPSSTLPAVHPPLNPH